MKEMPSPLPAEMSPILDRIEEARWQSIEETEIAVSEGLHHVQRANLAQSERALCVAVLLVLRCLNSFRRDNKLTQEEVQILEEVSETYAKNSVLSDLLWLASVRGQPAPDLAEDAERRANDALSIGLPWFALLLFEQAVRCAVSFSSEVDARALQERVISTVRDISTPQTLMFRAAFLPNQAFSRRSDPAFHEELKEVEEAAMPYRRIHINATFARTVVNAFDQDKQSFERSTQKILRQLKSFGSLLSTSQILGNLSQLARHIGEHLTAIRLGREGLQIARLLNDQRSVLNLSHILVWAYDEIGLSEIALEVGLEGKAKAIEAGEKTTTFDFCLVNGKVLSRLGRMDEALVSFDEAYEYATYAVDRALPRVDVLTYKGHALTRANRPTESLPILMQALDMVTSKIAETEDSVGELDLQLDNVQWALARTHHLLDEHAKALEYYLAIQRSGLFVGSDESIEIRKQIAECYFELDDHQHALESYRDYVAVQTSANSAEQQQAIVRQEVERSVEMERQRAERERQLLHAILPSSIAERRLAGERRIADTVEDVVILFIDIAGFTPKAESLSAHQLIDYLESIFGPIEQVIKKHGGEKIKTIGDAFMAACGATASTDRRAERMVRAALEISALHGNHIRIGIHSGQVVAGVLGEGRFTFDLWGDAVNIAARLEQYGEPGRVHVSGAIANAIMEVRDVSLVPRGPIDIKGKGLMETYWVESR